MAHIGVLSVKEHRGLVETVVRQFRPTSVCDFDDLRQVATIRMWQEIPRFDETHGVRQVTFLAQRMKWAVCDEHRAMRFGDRKTIVDTIPLDNCDPPAPCEYDTVEKVIDLERALETLPLKHRIVLQSIYYDDVPQKSIATSLGVTESRVSQIRREGVEMLRNRMSA